MQSPVLIFALTKGLAVPGLLSPLELLLVAGCGFVVGGLAGLLGIGGSFLLVPLLHVVLKIPVEIAVGSTSCQLLGPSTTALLARRISLTQFRLPLIITGGIITGVLVGTLALQSAREFGMLEVNSRIIPASELLVLGTYQILLVGIGSFALFEVRRQSQGRSISRGLLAKLPIPPFEEFDELDVRRLSIPVLSLFGLGTGILAGLLGISGALILIPGLVYLLDIRSKQAILVSLVVVWITSLIATIFHAWYGNVDLRLALALLFGGTIGARIGAELSHKVPGTTIRSSIGWLALLTAALVLLKLVNLLTSPGAEDVSGLVRVFERITA